MLPTFPPELLKRATGPGMQVLVTRSRMPLASGPRGPFLGNRMGPTRGWGVLTSFGPAPSPEHPLGRLRGLAAPERCCAPSPTRGWGVLTRPSRRPTLRFSAALPGPGRLKVFIMGNVRPALSRSSGSPAILLGLLAILATALAGCNFDDRPE